MPRPSDPFEWACAFVIGGILIVTVLMILNVCSQVASGQNHVRYWTSYEDESMKCVDSSGGYDGKGYFQPSRHECVPKVR